MSDACSIHTTLTTWPLMSMPRMFPACVRTSSALLASLMPPALPRPPTCTWALTTTGYPTRSAAATASSTGCPASAAALGPPLFPRRHRDAVAREQLLALVLEEVHGRGNYVARLASRESSADSSQSVIAERGD